MDRMETLYMKPSLYGWKLTGYGPGAILIGAMGALGKPMFDRRPPKVDVTLLPGRHDHNRSVLTRHGVSAYGSITGHIYLPIPQTRADLQDLLERIEQTAANFVHAGELHISMSGVDGLTLPPETDND